MMEITLDRTGTVTGLETLLNSMETNPAVHGILLLSCDANGFTPADIDPLLRNLRKPVFGGIFPQIIHDGEHLERGTIALGLTQEPVLTLIRDLSDPNQDLSAAVADAVDPDVAETTLFVFVDGFARRISGLIDALFENHGLELNYIGGGAGSLSLRQKPCLFTPDGLLEDAAILAQTAWPSGIGVAHGWQVVSDVIKVTRSDRNTIQELNYRPAFDVYREIVEPQAAATLTAENFFDIAKGFPFGIRKMGTEVVVRDPLMVDAQGNLVCVGEVPENAFVHILRGETQALVAAAGSANELATEALAVHGGDPSLRIFIDCISRVLFLEEEFPKELNAVNDDLPMIGALTLGEIANSGDHYLEFYNKTAVVGLFANTRIEPA